MLRKKLFVPLIAIIMGLSLIPMSNTFATDCSKLKGNTQSYNECIKVSGNYDGSSVRDCQTFLGMPSWDCGLPDIRNEETLKKGIWVIVSNVFNAITVLATYLVIGYIIYGAYQYIFSGGETGKVANGKKTLNQAFIGLAIVLSANIIVSAIRIALIGNTEFSMDHDVSDLVETAIEWVIGVSGLVSAVFVVGGGIFYMTSAGDPNKLQKAKNMIKYALIGLAAVALSQAIASFMFNVIENAQDITRIDTTLATERNQNDIEKIS